MKIAQSDVNNKSETVLQLAEELEEFVQQSA